MLQINTLQFFLYFFLYKLNNNFIKNIYFIYLYFNILYKKSINKKVTYIWSFNNNIYKFNKVAKSTKYATVSKLRFYLNIKKTTKFIRKTKLKNFIEKIFNKKLLKKKNFLNYMYSKSISIQKIKINFNLKQRLFLSQKNITHQIWSFLYKRVNTKFFLKNKFQKFTNSDTDRKLLFFNFHKPLIWKMRTARYVHWNLRTRGKLNKYRYDKLLGRELVFRLKTKFVQLLLCVFFISYYSILSWKQLLLVINHNLIIINSVSISKELLNVKKGDIIELPYGLNYRAFNSHKYNNIVKNSKKTVYKLYKTKWLFRKKKNKLVPKIFKKLPVPVQLFGKTIAYDPMLNVFAVIYDVPAVKHNTNWSITKSSVLSLQSWRYNFN